MQGVGINTAQNVMIDYEPASIGDRFVALIIDWFIVYGYLFLMFLAYDSLTYKPNSPWLILLIFVVPWTFYDLACEVIMNGQTFGKRVRKIKVVKLDGSPPGFFNYFLRWILRPVDSLYGLGIVVILVNGKGQRIGDLAGGTTVVRLQITVTLRDTLYTETEDDHQPQFPEVMRLSDEQVRLIRDAVNHNLSASNPVLVSKIFEKTKSIMKVEPDMPELKFLYTVLKDYNHYTQRSR